MPADVIVADTTDCIEINSTTSTSVSSQNVVEETLAEPCDSPMESADQRGSASDDENDSCSGKKSAPPLTGESSAKGATPSQKKRRRLSLEEKKAREAEIDRKKQEREKKKEELERKRQELEQQKKERLEARQRKIDASKKAEKEKEEKRKQLELEKEEKRKQKEAEKEAAEEARKRKQEEKEAAEEAKRKKVEEEQAKKTKAAEMFKSFFVKPKESDNDRALSPESADTNYKSFGPWKMFQLHPNQKLSPICRLTKEAKSKAKKCLDDQMPNQKEVTQLLGEYKSGSREFRHHPPTYPKEEDAVIQLDDQKNRQFMRAKLLQFEEDIRPPYFGTWRKKTKFISARRPFGQDTQLFDYDNDSANEWEEPEDGEDIMSSSKESGDESDVSSSFLLKFSLRLFIVLSFRQKTQMKKKMVLLCPMVICQLTKNKRQKK